MSPGATFGSPVLTYVTGAMGEVGLIIMNISCFTFQVARKAHALVRVDVRAVAVELPDGTNGPFLLGPRYHGSQIRRFYTIQSVYNVITPDLTDETQFGRVSVRQGLTQHRRCVTNVCSVVPLSTWYLSSHSPGLGFAMCESLNLGLLRHM